MINNRINFYFDIKQITVLNIEPSILSQSLGKKD